MNSQDGISRSSIGYNNPMPDGNHGPLRRIAEVSYILQNYILARRKPFLASFKLTYCCNLRCQPCPFYSMAAPELTYSEATNVIDRLFKRGSRMLVFEGGEPLLWRDGDRRIHDLVAYARQNFFSVGMTTNGSMPLDVPTDVLWVSVDGLRDTHNTLRGAPIFNQVIANARASAHPRLLAHVTVNSVNAEEVPELLKFLDGIFRGITLQFYYPFNHKDALFLDFDRREQLLDKIIQLKRSGIRILNSTAALQALKRNHWICRDTLVDNANPDGSLQQGCYLRGRADIDCSRCGFSPHTEISLACRGNLQAIRAGMSIFM
jgi:MoaA/NifB/PqqE/SkfB family radical SAM enzyme